MPYRNNIKNIPHEQGLTEEDGWIQMQVQFLINQQNGNSDKLVFGYTVLPPGARHERHRHFHCDEFLFVLKGKGYVYTDTGVAQSGEGDVLFTERGHWHGFNNTSDDDVHLIWGWSGAGSLEAAGYEIPEDTSAFNDDYGDDA